ncbi:DUF6961 family protein [Sphingomonas xinjiangensis]
MPEAGGACLRWQPGRSYRWRRARRLTGEEEPLAEALAVESMHGDDAPDHVYERVKAPAEAGDMAGVKRWMQIGDRLDRFERLDRSAN